jgi:hypothetical protein
MSHAEKTIDILINDGTAIVRSIVTENGIQYYAVDDLIEQKTLHIPTSEMTLYFLTADTTNGVQSGNGENVCTSDPISQNDFFDSLKTLSDEDCIGSYVTYQMYNNVEKIYGITN